MQTAVDTAKLFLTSGAKVPLSTSMVKSEANAGAAVTDARVLARAASQLTLGADTPTKLAEALSDMKDLYQIISTHIKHQVENFKDGNVKTYQEGKKATKLQIRQSRDLQFSMIEQEVGKLFAAFQEQLRKDKNKDEGHQD